MAPNCFFCGATNAASAPLLDCSACLTASYCDTSCQRADWKSHKPVCKSASAADTVIASAGAQAKEDAERSEVDKSGERSEENEKKVDESSKSNENKADESSKAIVIEDDTFGIFDHYAAYFETDHYAPKAPKAEDDGKKVFVPEHETGGWKEVEGEKKESVLKGSGESKKE
jgi:hypothetical protein